MIFGLQKNLQNRIALRSFSQPFFLNMFEQNLLFFLKFVFSPRHIFPVMASGHLIALLSSAVEMLKTCGLNETKAREILRPLIESTIKNLSSQTFAEALTGPFARADFETIRLHLETLGKNAAPQDLETYRQLGLRSLHLAEEQGADKENLAKIGDLMINGEW